MGTLCVRGSAVQITAVDPVDTAGSIVITSGGVRPNPMQAGQDGLGAEGKPLSSYANFAHQPVSGNCWADPNKPTSSLSELGVEFMRSATTTAISRSLKLTYTAAGKQQSVLVPATIVLCAPTDHRDGCTQ